MQSPTHNQHRYTILGFAPVIGLVAIVLAAPAAFAGESLGENVNDMVLKARIETTFAMNEALSAVDIDTDVEDGVVTLTGKVDEHADSQLAEDIANSFEDTRGVVNELKLSPSPMVEDDSGNEDAKPQWRNNIDDALTAANVRRRIGYHTGLRNLVLDIDVDGNTVSVAGKVDTEEQRKAVIDTVRDTKGVETVTANLAVAKEETVGKEVADVWDETRSNVDDEWVETRVKTSLLLSQSVDLIDLNVEVDKHVCVLSGLASSENEKAAAERIASDVYGVKEVVNEIEIVEHS